MYKQKSEIIGQIQLYHKKVADLYHDIYEKAMNKEIKSLLFELYEHEADREKYLERHKNIARAMDCWLDFPCDKLNKQINECLELSMEKKSELKMEDILRLELHFDDCLIKIYNILSAENALSETAANIFYYMLKKTAREQNILANMLYNSKTNLHSDFSINNI